MLLRDCSSRSTVAATCRVVAVVSLLCFAASGGAAPAAEPGPDPAADATALPPPSMWEPMEDPLGADWGVVTDAQAVEHVVRLQRDLDLGTSPVKQVRAAEIIATLAPRYEYARVVLRKSLDHRSERVRVIAAGALLAWARRAGGDVARVPAGGAAADGGDEFMDAVRELAKAAPDDPKLLPALTEALRHDDDTVRAFAARTLGDMGPQAEAAVPALRNLLRDPARHVRSRAVVALEAVRPPDQTAKTLADRIVVHDSKDAETATAELARLGGAARDVIPRLIYHLGSQNVTIRTQALRALGKIGRDDAEAVAAVVNALRADEVENGVATGGAVRRAAARALDEMRLPPAVLIDALLPLTHDPSAVVRREVAARIKVLGREAVPVLSEMLTDAPDAPRRVAAAERLAGLAEEFPAEAVPPLLGALAGDDPDLRLAALHGLRWMPQPAAAVPVVARALDSPSEPLRRAALETLVHFGPAAAAAKPGILRLLTDPNPSLRADAAAALARIAPESPEAADAMLSLIRSENPAHRRRALETLSSTPTPGPELIDGVIALLDDPDNDVRLPAVAALERLGPAGRPAAARLARMVDNRHPAVRRAAARALVNVEPTDAQLAAAYLAAVRNRDPDARAALAPAVRRASGDGAKALIPRLTELASNDPDLATRLDARDALRAIGAETPK